MSRAAMTPRPRLTELLALGEEVTDAEEEAFLLFSQHIPTDNLGFINSRAASLELTIRGKEYTIHQSPTLLSSSRAGGTTGAVLWKITPLFAEWIAAPSNPLWTHALLSPDSIVVELGCGISALVALALATSVQHYLATDQEYVRRLFRTNLDENAAISSTHKVHKAKSGRSASKKQLSSPPAVSRTTNVTFTTLDWELDQPELLKGCINADGSGRIGHARHRRDSLQDQDDDEDRGFDLLLSCDCIYNEALVAPFVRTCAEICRLRPAYEPTQERASQPHLQPTVCIVAQQQRAPEVFETWLRETLREFRVWRLNDEVLGEGLKNGSGYLVHLLLAREKN
ncbi:uncharacterized protein N7459_009213 [Penicillium hispanicum]|uniref:uncharacterized protein n=1 Tax=Penicillium hispanicum TaxID=1080232 RepID=UPI00253F8D75|nr:uncharacterized protein N7459_009213 [Penicillium hispanicum]KAJ5569783.1 hypothetical protein N7459_009213 [Penicillium hispanicum]